MVQLVLWQKLKHLLTDAYLYLYDLPKLLYKETHTSFVLHNYNFPVFILSLILGFFNWSLEKCEM
jgi:hypothetical protein